MSATRSAQLVTLAAAVFTIAVALLPRFPLAVRDPALHVAVETTAAWISLTAAMLLSGRSQRRRRLPDMALVAALGLSGLANLLLSALPSVLGGITGEALSTWGALTLRTIAAVTFAAAAVAPDRSVARSWGHTATGACLGLTALVAGGVWVIADRLPSGVGSSVEEAVTILSDLPNLGVHPVLAAAQLLMMVAYVVAAVGFTRRDRQRTDPLLPWLAAAAVAAATARLHYLLMPSLYAEVVYSGDLLRVTFYSLLLGGILSELRATWLALAAGAAAEERRRVARDLHDGLAQELAFISTQASWLAKRQPDEPRTALVASAAQRALDESRRAIDTLSGRGPIGLPATLVRAVEDVANRFQQRVELQIDEHAQAPSQVSEQLVRIVREAVGNAARHGRPQLITVRLEDGDSLVLEVADDGTGFDPEAAARESLRFGLRSMSERAESLGGTLRIDSTPGAGTTVRVEVPWKT